MSFSPGDTVKLKSGGELMVVEEIGDELVSCVWMNGKKVERDSFEPVVLEAAVKEKMAIASSSTSVPSMRGGFR